MKISFFFFFSFFCISFILSFFLFFSVRYTKQNNPSFGHYTFIFHHVIILRYIHIIFFKRHLNATCVKGGMLVKIFLLHFLLLYNILYIFFIFLLFRRTTRHLYTTLLYHLLLYLYCNTNCNVSIFKCYAILLLFRRTFSKDIMDEFEENNNI